MTLDAGSALTVAVSLIVGVLSSYITFRLQFERFKAMDEQREEDWVKWRDHISKEVEELKRAANITQLALLAQTVDQLVKRVEELWKYTADLKHMHIDPYEREVAKLRNSVDQLEQER